MNKNPIEELIKKEGADDSVIFVFPSDIAATLWLDKALDITGLKTLPVRRFIAWDRFKEQAVQSTIAGKRPVSAVIRKLYALELAERNHAAEKPLFSSLIPARYADDGTVFAPWIARLLSQLEVWEQKTLRSHHHVRDIEDADLSFLKDDYRHFLDANHLYEPSWQRPPLKDTGNTFYIFFPEAIEDFGEYATILGGATFITTVTVPEIEEESSIHVYENTREEIRSVSLKIEALLRSGIKAENIAVSIPDIENVSPYFLRELSLRGIPFEFRAGEPLGTRPAGRLFSLIQKCVSSSFSFASLKALLLDRLIPWKQRANAEDLVRFGIRNHCVTSWKDEGKLVDIWEEAFKTPATGETGDRQLRDWYRKLTAALSQMVTASSFTEIRNRYFVFRETFLDLSLFSSEDDAVVARCIEELNALAGLENSYSAYIPANPYSFFLSVLNDKNYVPQRVHGGVSIFPYRVAGGTPYSYHFILDASQDQATVLYRQLPFLMLNKRASLNLLEDDASAAFFNIYRCSPLNTGEAKSEVHFSFSSRSFSGYRTPHGYFRNEIHADIAVNDPFAEEKQWLSLSSEKKSLSLFPDRLYHVQKKGHAASVKRDVPKGFSYLRTPYGNSVSEVVAQIQKKQMNGSDLRVSQTDLGTFSLCNARWFLGKILCIEEAASDAELMNERNLGLLYHDVLKKVYEKIRETDLSFRSSRLSEYRSWATTFAESAAAEHAEFRGPLAAPLISSLVGKIAGGVIGMLEKDSELLDGFIPEFLEDDITFNRDGICYYGRIDRISRRSADNATVLIDYKSGKIPSTAVYKTDEETRIGDFQIPMYVFLAEESPTSPYKGSRIEHVWFGSIKEADYRPIINDSETIKCGSKRGMVSRDEFESAMESFKMMTSFFATSVQGGDFTRPETLPLAECTKCEFQKICRYTYAVRP